MLRSSFRPRARAAIAPLLLVTAACGGEPSRPAAPLPMEEEVYVEIMARLDLIRRQSFPAERPEARDALADTARAALLAERGVGPEQLLRFAEIVGADPGRMEVLSGRIAALADSLREVEAAAARDSVAALADSTPGSGSAPEARDSTSGADVGSAGGRDSLASRDSVPPPPAEAAPETGNQDLPGRLRTEPSRRPPSRPGARDAARRPLPQATPPDSS